MDLYDNYETLRTKSPRRPRHASRVDPAVAADINTRMAAMRVRSWCNTHECTEPSEGVCHHSNHRRDADKLLSQDDDFPGMLDMLGLPREYPACTEAEKRTWLRWIGQSGPGEDLAA